MRRTATLAFTAALTTLATTAFAATANPAFNGTWKSNPAKSQLTGRTVSFAKEGAGFRYSNGSFMNFFFACDGKDYTANFANYTSACKQTGPRTYEVFDKAGGKLERKSETTVSPDGKTLTDKMVDYEANGTTRNSSAVYERVAGNPADGLAGTWKTVKRDVPPRTLTYKITGDHVLLTYPADKETIEAKLDGTPAALKGPDISGNHQAAITLVAPNKIHLVPMLNGKPVADITDTLSADGKSITSIAYIVGKENEKTTQIFEKQ